MPSDNEDSTPRGSKPIRKPRIWGLSHSDLGAAGEWPLGYPEIIIKPAWSHLIVKLAAVRDSETFRGANAKARVHQLLSVVFETCSMVLPGRDPFFPDGSWQTVLVALLNRWKPHAEEERRWKGWVTQAGWEFLWRAKNRAGAVPVAGENEDEALRRGRAECHEAIAVAMPLPVQPPAWPIDCWEGVCGAIASVMGVLDKDAPSVDTLRRMAKCEALKPCPIILTGRGPLAEDRDALKRWYPEALRKWKAMPKGGTHKRTAR